MSNYLIERFQKGYPGAVDGTHAMMEYRKSLLVNIITKNLNKNFANEFSKDELEFINSNCISGFVKELMIICLKNDKEINENTSAAMKILQSKKSFNKMTVDEIEKIVEDLSNSRGFNHVPGLYKRYFFTVSAKGVKEYLLTRVDKFDIVQEFLQTSGLSTRAEYYAGDGVRSWDLGPKHLKSIYLKFLNLNPQLAVEFYKMVMSMHTLGASEFIDTLYRFARNDFKTEGLFVANNNVATDNATQASMVIGLYAALGNYQSKDEQVRLSNDMKYTFFWNVTKSLSEIDPELHEKYMKAAIEREMNNQYHCDILTRGNKSKEETR